MIVHDPFAEPAIFPTAYEAIMRDTLALGFDKSSEALTGALLRTLAASKPGGKLLEIGTGTGIGSCWLLDGMDAHSQLITVERDEQVNTIAQRHLGGDARVQFVTADAGEWLKTLAPQQFDLIFADTFPGKFFQLEDALNALKIGGLYVIDDLLPQPTWLDNHQPAVEQLIQILDQRSDLVVTKLHWASGIMICTKRN